MIIKANSTEEALKIAVNSLGLKENFEIKIISPVKNILGFKLKGKYEVVLKKNINDIKNYKKDGYVEISSGEIKIRNPENSNNYAKIIANNPNVEIYKNGIKMNGTFKVRREDKIEFAFIDVKPTVELKVELSEDELEAKLIIKKTPGKSFYLKDTSKCNTLSINDIIGYKEIPVYEEIDFDDCYNKLMGLKVVPSLIDKNSIYNLINSPHGGACVVAKGKKPIDGRDAKVHYYFKRREYLNPEFSSENKINLYDHTIIPTVEIGDLLAAKTLPPLPGINGFTVTGKIIKAKGGKDVPFIAGRGTTYSDNGKKIIAISPGRPILKNGEISVIPTLVIPNDVDAKTGNIYFDGDIIIKGSVLDNMKVVSKGDVIVYGNAIHCTIMSSGNIKIFNNVISSKIVAGSNVLINTTVLPSLESILSYLNIISNSLKSLKGINYIKQMSLFLNIIEKYSPKILSKCIGLEKIIILLEKDESEEISSLIKNIKITFSTISNLVPDSAEVKLYMLYNDLNNFILKLKNTYNNMGNVIFNYAQNSIILSNGSVYILGNGTFQSRIIAKYTIYLYKSSSIVRGGLLIAGSKMKLGIVGSPASIPTYCKVINEKGKIITDFCYDNVTLKVGNDN